MQLSSDELRWLWFEKLARQLAGSAEPYPENDARAVWRQLLEENNDPCRYKLNLDEGSFLSDITSLHRALSRRAFRLMDGARPLLEVLRSHVKLGIVTDGQPDYILTELQIAASPEGYGWGQPLTDRDIAGARAAGMRSVLMLSHYGSKDIALGEPDFVVDRAADIAGLIEPLLPS